MSTTSPSSSAQQARQALADRLRELRLDAGLTGRGLAAAAGWDCTKVSKIEHAARAPNIQDIRTWCRVCGAEDQAADLVAALHAVEGAFVEWKRLQRSGLRRLQESRMALYERTRVFRVYEPGVVPGLLQTPGYVRAVLTKVGSFRGSPTGDLDEAVAARIARQRILREGDHRFAFIVEESALWTRIGGTEVLADQLMHLLHVMRLPSVSLGVVPADTDRGLWPVEGFWMAHGRPARRDSPVRDRVRRVRRVGRPRRCGPRADHQGAGRVALTHMPHIATLLRREGAASLA